MNAAHFLRSAIRRLARALGAALRTPANVYDEMHRGALVGCVCAVSLCVACGLPLAGVLGVTLAGLCAGSVIGLVLWSSSPGLPEDLVLPPAQGQERRIGAERSLARRLHRVRSR